MRRQENRTVSLKHFFKRNGTRISLTTLLIFAFQIFLPFVYQNAHATIYSSILGRVIEAGTDKGLENIQVTAHKIGSPEPDNRLYYIATTDKNGYFNIQGIPPGDYEVFALPQRPPLSPGFKPTSVSNNNFYISYKHSQIITVVEGKNVVNLILSLKKGGGISGRVTIRETFDPLRNTQILVYSTQQAFAGAFTDNDGYYTISNFPAGIHNVLVLQAVGYTFGIQVNVSVQSNAVTQNVNFELITQPSKVMGLVRSAVDNSPVQNGYVTFTKKGSSFHGVGATDSTGKFIIQGLVPGIYQVVAGGLHHLELAMDDVLVQNGDNEINILLQHNTYVPSATCTQEDCNKIYDVQYQECLHGGRKSCDELFSDFCKSLVWELLPIPGVIDYLGCLWCVSNFCVPPSFDPLTCSFDCITLECIGIPSEIMIDLISCTLWPLCHLGFGAGCLASAKLDSLKCYRDALDSPFKDEEL